MKRYIISDLHLGHTGVTRFRPEFESDDNHHEYMYQSLLNVDSKRAMFFLLGDIAFTPEWLQKMSELRGRTILFCGNHDLDRSVNKMSDIVEAYDEVYALKKYKGFWLSHAPIHEDELRGKWNIHGHTHNYIMVGDDGLPDVNYVNVCPEFSLTYQDKGKYTNIMSVRPLTWEEAISHLYHEHCCNISSKGVRLNSFVNEVQTGE